MYFRTKQMLFCFTIFPWNIITSSSSSLLRTFPSVLLYFKTHGLAPLHSFLTGSQDGTRKTPVPAQHPLAGVDFTQDFTLSHLSPLFPYLPEAFLGTAGMCMIEHECHSKRKKNRELKKIYEMPSAPQLSVVASWAALGRPNRIQEESHSSQQH